MKEIEKELKECFALALKEEERGKKHKGLIVTNFNIEEAKCYLEKAKESLEFCDIYKQKEADYKIPEEWFYALYYCGLAILSKFGVESRSQRYTALLLSYLQNKELINYNKEFIDRIVVYKEKERESDVDEREKARYGSWIKNDKVRERYNDMMNLCKQAITQAEEVIFSKEDFTIPKELLE